MWLLQNNKYVDIHLPGWAVCVLIIRLISNIHQHRFACMLTSTKAFLYEVAFCSPFKTGNRSSGCWLLRKEVISLVRRCFVFTPSSQVAWFVLGLRRQFICLLSIWWHNTDVVPKSKILHFDVNVTVSPISWDIDIYYAQILTGDSDCQIPLVIER